MPYIVSVNISRKRAIALQGRNTYTGIYKIPVTSTVVVGTLGLHGDEQADLKHHGGPEKAVYAYPLEHYLFWSEFLGVRDLPYGSLGENLTTRGLTEEEVCIGDVYQVGTARLSVTQPRVPCAKLARRWNRPDLPKEFLNSGRCGFYLRVLRGGVLYPGAPIVHLSRPEHTVTIAELHRLWHSTQKEPARLAYAVETPGLSRAWREDIRDYLVRVGYVSATTGD